MGKIYCCHYFLANTFFRHDSKKNKMNGKQSTYFYDQIQSSFIYFTKKVTKKQNQIQN